MSVTEKKDEEGEITSMGSQELQDAGMMILLVAMGVIFYLGWQAFSSTVSEFFKLDEE